MIPRFKKFGLATFFSIAVSFSSANSQEHASKSYANDLLGSIGGSSSV